MARAGQTLKEFLQPWVHQKPMIHESMFDRLTATAYETGQAVGVQLDQSLLAAVWVDGILLWALNGALIDPDLARSIINDLTT